MTMLCMYMHIHMCDCGSTHAIHTCLWRSGKSQVSVLTSHLNLCQGLVLLFICGICHATWASSSQEFAFLYLSRSCRRARIIGRRAKCLAFLCVFWGFELRSSHLHSEHLCHWAISPEPVLFFLNVFARRCEIAFWFAFVSHIIFLLSYTD